MHLLYIILIVALAAYRGCALAIQPSVVVQSLAQNYIKCLQTAPLLTNVATASALSVCSDGKFMISPSSVDNSSSFRSRISRPFSAVSQAFDRASNPLDENKKPRKHSIYRSFCISVYGAIVYGWLISYWYKFLNALIPPEGITVSKVLLKVGINQAIMAPGLNSLFFTFATLTRDLAVPLETRLATLKKKLRQDLLPTITRSCIYWGIVQFINFSYITKQYMLLYTNAAFVIWTTYVSYIGFRKTH
jgi:hypothetical protein